MNKLTAVVTLIFSLFAPLALSHTSGTGDLMHELEEIQRAAQLIRLAVAEGARPVLPSEILDSLANAGAVLQALGARSDQLTPSERLRLRNARLETIEGLRHIIGADTGRSELLELISATTAVLSAGAHGGMGLDSDLVREARALGDIALLRAASDFPALAQVSDIMQFRDRLREDVSALEFALALSPRVSRPVRPDVANVHSALMQRGGSGTEAAVERLASALEHIVETDRLDIDGRTVAQIMLDAVSQGAHGGSGALFDVAVDPTTRSVSIRLPGEHYHGAVSAVRLVSDRVPTGISFLRDGRALLVHDGVGIEIVPVPRDMVAFAAAIENAGFEFNLREQGRIELGLGGGQRFSAVTAFDNVPGSEADCAFVRFAEPATPVDTPEHAFRVICPDGRAQRIVPFVHSAAFYDALTEAGLDTVTDRNTGVIGIGQVGRFKPGFFFDELISDDIAFWQVNRSAAGIAFRFLDLTGNGADDVLMFSPRGVQPLYWVGP